MQVKTGTVKFPADKEFESKYKPGQYRQNIIIQLDDGSEEKLWFDSGKKPDADFQRGQSVQVLFEEGNNGKTNCRLLNNNSQAKPQPSDRSTELTPEQKRVIANYVTSQTDLLGFCLKTASEQFSEQVQSKEGISTLASTLYLAAQRKFNL